MCPNSSFESFLKCKDSNASNVMYPSVPYGAGYKVQSSAVNDIKKFISLKVKFLSSLSIISVKDVKVVSSLSYILLNLPTP